MNPFFKDFALNRDPRPASPVKDFKHGKGYGYNPTVPRTPLQKQEAKK